LSYHGRSAARPRGESVGSPAGRALCRGMSGASVFWHVGLLLRTFIPLLWPRRASAWSKEVELVLRLVVIVADSVY